MNDLATTIAPKSDQLNADDLIVGPMTICITSVKVTPKAADQPAAISFEGDNGKPYKPCKSMRRVLVHLWGPDTKAYAGRRLRLFRDVDVLFGGVKVGGIRISHMSHIDEPKTIALTVTRASRKPYTVQPLANKSPEPTAQPSPKVEATGELQTGRSAPGVKEPGISYADQNFDPARPKVILLPVGIEEMSPDECKAFAKALRTLIRSAPDADIAQSWRDRHAPELERLHARFPAMVKQIDDAVQEHGA